MKLAEGVQEYLFRKRELGMRHSTEESILKSFVKTVGNPDLHEEMTPRVIYFLDSTSSTEPARAAKCRLLIRFFRFWSMRDLAEPLGIAWPRRIAVNTRVPYVYSEKQVVLLLKATDECQKRSTCDFPGESLRILLLLLYATGMTIREALELKADAFIANSGALVIHSSRYRTTRRLPLCSDLCEVLLKYESSKVGRKTRCVYFLWTVSGRPVTSSTLIEMFQRLRKIAFPQTTMSPNLRLIMRDLRPTFAVHRITSWLRCGADLNRLLPALAVYMGLAGLESTQKFMALSPERFRNELNKLSPASSEIRWADDEQLMSFLSKL